MREKEYCDSPIFQLLLTIVRYLYIYRYCKYAMKITKKKIDIPAASSLF